MSYISHIRSKTILALAGMVLALFISGTTIAQPPNPAQQTFDQGYKFLYNENFPAAIATIQQALEKSPNNPSYVYWLGVAYISNKQAAEAKSLFQKVLASGVKHPLLDVGLASADLFLGAPNAELRPRFDAAIAASKTLPKKAQSEVLNAIGLANASGGMKLGDGKYGIDVLNQSLKLDPNNPETLVSMGLCYLKQGPEAGTPAMDCFKRALEKNPGYARASYRIGRMYQSQISTEPMLEEYQRTISIDPKYTPVYLTLFNYYRERETNEAIKYLNLYAANTVLDCDMEYFIADYYFRAGRYAESIQRGKTMEAGACKDFYRLPVLFAMNNNRLGDSAQALSQMDHYFKTAPAGKADEEDYQYAAELAERFAGKEDLAVAYYSKAIELDTSITSKTIMARKAAAVFEKAKRYPEQLEWLRKAATMKGAVSSADYYAMCMSATNAKDFTVLDGLATEYMNAYPDQPQGYNFKINAAKALDTDTTKGLAIEPINKYNTLLEQDVEKNRKRLYGNYYYQLLYFVQYNKDYEKALAILDKMLVLYPDPATEENKFALQVKQQISVPAPKKK